MSDKADSQFAEVMNLRQEMCDSYATKGCKFCLMYIENNGKNMSCSILLTKHPEIAEDIIYKWDSSRDSGTNGDKFQKATSLLLKQLFGLDHTGVILHNCELIECPNHKPKFSALSRKCARCKFNHFWERGYKELDALSIIFGTKSAKNK